MHPAAAAPGLMQVMLDAARCYQRHLQLLTRPGHAQVSRAGQVRPAPAHAGRAVIDHLIGFRPRHRRSRRPGCFPRPRLLPLPRRSRFGGSLPGRSSAEGGIEELRLLRPSRRLSSAASARSSSIARPCSPSTRPCSAITESRAAHATHPAAGGGSSVTGHHDQDNPAVIKPARWAGASQINE